MNQEQRASFVEGANAALVNWGFEDWMLVTGTTVDSIRILDEEGDPVTTLSDELAFQLAKLDEQGLAVVLDAMPRMETAAFKAGWKGGEKAGRREAVATVHEFLGVDRIVEALRPRRDD